MKRYNNQEQLFKDLKPAFKVKLTLLKDTEYRYIRDVDIWNYLKESKWVRSVNLGISDMTNDIINVNAYEIDKYLKDRMYNEKKKLM